MLTIGLLAVLAAGGPARGGVPPETTAKSCAAGTKSAVIGGKRRCLKAGQKCSRRYDRRYHRYGFHCHGARLTAAKLPALTPAGEYDVTTSQDEIAWVDVA
jgi:hypothetical protein